MLARRSNRESAHTGTTANSWLHRAEGREKRERKGREGEGERERGREEKRKRKEERKKRKREGKRNKEKERERERGYLRSKISNVRQNAASSSFDMKICA